MIISEAEKNRIRKLHRELFILKEHALGGMASVGSGFVNPQGGTGRIGEFLARQAELGEDCGGTHEDSVEKNQASYDFGEVELEEKSDVVYDDENFLVIEKDTEEDTEEDND